MSSISADYEITVVLDNRRSIKVASGAQSLASSMAGHRLQREMLSRIETARDQAISEAGIVRRTLDIQVGKFVTLQVLLSLIAWLAVR